MRSYNQILACLHGIGWMTAQIEQVREQMHMGGAEQLAAGKEIFLQDTATKLQAILQGVGDYMNNCDIVTDDDEAVLSPLFDATSA